MSHGEQLTQIHMLLKSVTLSFEDAMFLIRIVIERIR